jgi:hyaluronan synthase
MIKKKKEYEDILLNPKSDRRILPKVPDLKEGRNNSDRRGGITGEEMEKDPLYFVKNQRGIRYLNSYRVKVAVKDSPDIKNFCSDSIDISDTGVLIKTSRQEYEALENASKIKLKFAITEGSMPEGYESRVKIQAEFIRGFENEKDGVHCGLKFKEPLSDNILRRKGRFELWFSSLILFGISLFIILMRAESIVYFEFNKYLYLYSIVAAVFLLSRYFFGIFYKPVKVNSQFTPGVTVIIPCFNEEEWIDQTIISCMNQDYPIDKLEVIVVDDCSNDKSVEAIIKTIDKLYHEAERFLTKDRLKYIVQKENKGKREALAVGALEAKHELLVFVDSDSFLDPFAIRNLVQPFKDPKMGGVSGRTDVANTYTNGLTKMQSVRYYIAFRIMKAAESYFDAVTCLSGPLACYRKDIVLENMEEWLNQKFLGQTATFGDDRSLTNFVLKKHRTSYQDTAICRTIVPNKYKVFLKQQMRWKRSWLRESIIAAKFIWKKEPFMALFFYIGLVVPIAAPVIVLYNLIYVPISYRIFPITFLVGLLMMALLMSFFQLFFRKSRTWIFGLYFCLFYEAVLLWQMPVAWVTFWKSTWGTRMTPQDIEESNRKEKKRGEKNINAS